MGEVHVRRRALRDTDPTMCTRSASHLSDITHPLQSRSGTPKDQRQNITPLNGAVVFLSYLAPGHALEGKRPLTLQPLRDGGDPLVGFVGLYGPLNKLPKSSKIYLCL